MEWAREHDLLPLSYFAKMRAESPLALENNVWNVYRYNRLKEIFADHDHFSSDAMTEEKEPIEFSILRIDPPKHRQLRTLVTTAFTPRSIEEMIPRIESVTHELLDKAAQEGRMDAVRDFTGPLPVIIIAEMLGIPASDREQFREWSDALVSNDYERYVNCQKEMSVYFEAISEERRHNPQDDLITRLVQATADGEPLSSIELIGFCILLLVAGNETTTNLLSSALLCFDSDREAWRDIREDRSLLPGAIEEVLRYASPIQVMDRRIKKDVEVDGQLLKAGQYILLWIGSANHDESVFDQPSVFNIRRHPNPHVAFGHGIHFCLGSQLARLEAKIALNAMLDRFPNYRRDHSHRLERIDSQLVFGVKSLPIILD
ncbi:cytochrome P450 [Paenibacillus dendritiformis]|uniref:cytochrome P450 n=1 Tax=Paenibacillus dendritiformis TaxID=130049 RepID=UPI00365F6402